MGIHVVFCSTSFYLLLFSYAMALECAEQMWIGYYLIILKSSFVVGLRHIGRKFADPYGNDVEDYAVLSSVTGTLKGSRQILEAIDLGAVDAAMEEWMATGKRAADT